MVFGWDDAAVGGLSIAGGIIGGLQSAQNSRSNQDHAFKQQMEASNTAHQRQVEDLRKAGLNPILAAGGSGASTPSATASDSPDMSGAVGTGINTALAHKMQKNEVKNIQEDTKLKGYQAAEISARQSKMYDERALLTSQAEQVRSETTFQNLKNNLMRETMTAQIKEAKAKGDWATVNQLLGAIGSTTKAISDVYPSIKIKGK